MRGSTPQEKDLCNDRKVCYYCNYILPSQVHIRGAFSEVPLIDTGVVSRGRRQEGLKFVRRKYIKARQQAAGKPLEQGTEGRKKQQRPEEKISGSLGHYQPSHLRFTIYKVPRA
jgi:hypothetical protein